MLHLASRIITLFLQTKNVSLNNHKIKMTIILEVNNYIFHTTFSLKDKKKKTKTT